MRRDFTVCPRCGSHTSPAVSFLGTPSEFWRKCDNCNTYINTYIPQAHQEAFHRDAHRFKGSFGGYGTGKTTTSREEFYKHMLITPGGNTLIGANINAQYEQTIKRDIEQDIPADFVKDVSVQKAYMDFKNGHRLMFRPFDDPGKLRSLNISMFIIVEASEVDPDIYAQLKTRIRNRAATVQAVDEEGNPIFEHTARGVPIPVDKADWREGIIESNPDSGWIRSEVLLASDDIQKFGSVTDTYAVLPKDRDPATSSHIAATDVNEFLPKGFIEEVSKNKPQWWINRYIRGSFSYAEGLVYPNAPKCIVNTFEVPKHWKRIIAFDYGLSDDAVFLFGAIDEAEGILYIYKEIRTNNKSVEELAQLYFEGIKDIPSGGIWGQPIIDPKSGPKRDYNQKSLADHFLELGISFKPGHISVDARVFRLNTYIESGKLKIMDCCVGLIEELRDYKFPPKKLGMKNIDKPVDKNNHAINPLEWIVMELPSDPKNIVYGIYNRFGEDITRSEKEKEKQRVYWALAEPTTPDSSDSETLFGIDFQGGFGQWQ